MRVKCIPGKKGQDVPKHRVLKGHYIFEKGSLVGHAYSAWKEIRPRKGRIL